MSVHTIGTLFLSTACWWIYVRMYVCSTVLTGEDPVPCWSSIGVSGADLGGPTLQVVGQLRRSLVPLPGVVGVTDSRRGELGLGLRDLVPHGKRPTLRLLIQL